MGEPYEHDGREILHGRRTVSEKYQATRVDGLWYFHPADGDWLAFNANDSFSKAYKTEADALEAAEEWEAGQ